MTWTGGDSRLRGNDGGEVICVRGVGVGLVYWEVRGEGEGLVRRDGARDML